MAFNADLSSASNNPTFIKHALNEEFNKISPDDLKSFLRFLANNPDLPSADLHGLYIFNQDPDACYVDTALNLSFMFSRDVIDPANIIKSFDNKCKMIVDTYSLTNTQAIENFNQDEYEKTNLSITSRKEFNKLVQIYYPNEALTVTEFFKRFVDDHINPEGKDSEINTAIIQSVLYRFIPSVTNVEKLNLIKSDFDCTKIKFNKLNFLHKSINKAINIICDNVISLREDIKNEHKQNQSDSRTERSGTQNQREEPEISQRDRDLHAEHLSRSGTIRSEGNSNDVSSGWTNVSDVERGDYQRKNSGISSLSSAGEDNGHDLPSVHSVSESKSNTILSGGEGGDRTAQPVSEGAPRSDVYAQTNADNRNNFRRETSDLSQSNFKETVKREIFEDNRRSEGAASLLRGSISTDVRSAHAASQYSKGDFSVNRGESAGSSNSRYGDPESSVSKDDLSNLREDRRAVHGDDGVYEQRYASLRPGQSDGNSQEAAFNQRESVSGSTGGFANRGAELLNSTNITGTTDNSIKAAAGQSGSDSQQKSKLSNSNVDSKSLSTSLEVDETGDVQNTSNNSAPPVENKLSAIFKQNVSSTTISSENSTNAHIDKSDFEVWSEQNSYTRTKRFLDNLAAIKLVKDLEKENRSEISEEEKQILLKYTGFGGFTKDILDEYSCRFNDKYYYSLTDALKDNGVTEKEYTEILKACSTAYYTHTDLIDCIYEKLNEFGFKGGKILEPSCGVGKFIGRMPKDLAANSEVTGIELDHLTAKIASLLYPQSTIKNTGFEKTFAENYYDVAVGNVPFGSFTVFDKKNPDLNNLSIHNYFFAKALKEVKPGGVIAFVTSSYTLDSKSSVHREELAKNAHFLGAVRLPNNSFGDSDADVMTDIVFLQKRETPLQTISEDDPQFEWVWSEGSEQSYETSKGKSDSRIIYLNKYFKNHPEMIAGELSVGSSAFGPVYQVTSGHKFNMDSIETIRNCLKGVTNTNLKEIANTEVNNSISDLKQEYSDPAFIKADNYSYYIDQEGNVRYKSINSEYPEIAPYVKAAKKIAIFKELCEIRDLYKALRKMEINDVPENEIADTRNKLSVAYDNFRSKHLNEVLNDKKFCPKATDKAVLMYYIEKKLKIQDDNSFYCLSSLEVTGKNDQFVGKSDLFFKRTLFKKVVPTSAKNLQDALIISINEKGKIDIPYMASLLGNDPNEVADTLLKTHMAYIDPEQIIFDENNNIVDFTGFVTEDEYLSGNIYKKIDSINNIQNKFNTDYFSEQLKALKEIIPEPLTEDEISTKIGSRWIDSKYYTEFLNQFCQSGGIAGKFVLNPHTDQFEYINAEGNNKVNDYGYDCYYNYSVTYHSSSRQNTLTAADIFLKLLNGSSLVIKKSVSVTETDPVSGDSRESTKTETDEKATAAVLKIAEKMQESFNQWIFADYDRKNFLVDKYNKLFNAIKPREYNGELFNFNDINPDITLRPHQKNAIARSLLGGNALFAHEVGAGKTFEMCVSAMEKIRLGKAHRCVFVLPKAILSQFASDFYRLYPDINLLLPSKEDFSGENRRKFINRLTYGDQKIILMTKETFNSIPMSDDYKQQFLDNLIEERKFALQDNNLPSSLKKTIQRSLVSLENRKAKLLSSKDKTDQQLGITFEELGCDALYVDEAHNYKNAPIECSTAGVNTSSNSSQAIDMMMKCDYLNSKYNNKAIVFATGTPISNSVVDLYTMQYYLNKPALEDAGIYSLDGFLAQFGTISSEPEIDATAQNFVFKERLRSFRNVPDALKIFGECADIKTSEDLKDFLALPKAHNHIVTSSATPEQNELIKNIASRAIAVKNGCDPRIDNMLKISTDGRKIGLDPRLVDPYCSDDPNSKLNKCVENVVKIHENDPNAVQLIFCDLGTPNQKNEFNVYDDVKQKLIDSGFKSEEVRFIHEFDSEEKRLECFSAVNEGSIKVLLGSTSKLGTGVNVQQNLKAVHHLDINWKPSDLEQRNGRIVRQGNNYKDVDIYTYVSVGTFDSFMFQTVKRKADFINKIMKNKSGQKIDRNIELDKEDGSFSLSLEDCLAVSIKDPRIRDQMKLQRDIAQLEASKKYFTETYSRFCILVNDTLPKTIDNLKNKLILNNKAVEIIKKSELASKIIAERAKEKQSSSNNSNESKKSVFSIDLSSKYISRSKNQEISTYTDLSEAGKRILNIAAGTSDGSKNYLGNYCGLDMFVKKVQAFNGKISYTNLVYFYDPEDTNHPLNPETPIELGESASGNITRITNGVLAFLNRSSKIQEELDKQEKDLKAKSEYLEKNPCWDQEELLKTKKEEYNKLTESIENNFMNNSSSDSCENSDIFMEDLKHEDDLDIEEAQIADDSISTDNITNQEQLNHDDSQSEKNLDVVYIAGDANNQKLLEAGGQYLAEYKVFKIAKNNLTDYDLANSEAYSSLDNIDANIRLSSKELETYISANHDSNSSNSLKTIKR